MTPVTITGTPEADEIWLDAGDDTAYGGDGGDVIHGGPGNDLLHGDMGPGCSRATSPRRVRAAASGSPGTSGSSAPRA
jgi:hypothetical protein